MPFLVSLKGASRSQMLLSPRRAARNASLTVLGFGSMSGTHFQSFLPVNCNIFVPPEDDTETVGRAFWDSATLGEPRENNHQYHIVHVLKRTQYKISQRYLNMKLVR